MWMHNTHSRFSDVRPVSSFRNSSDKSFDTIGPAHHNFVLVIIARQVRQDPCCTCQYVDIISGQQLHQHLEEMFKLVLKRRNRMVQWLKPST